MAETPIRQPRFLGEKVQTRQLSRAEELKQALPGYKVTKTDYGYLATAEPVRYIAERDSREKKIKTGQEYRYSEYVPQEYEISPEGEVLRERTRAVYTAQSTKRGYKKAPYVSSETDYTKQTRRTFDRRELKSGRETIREVSTQVGQFYREKPVLHQTSKEYELQKRTPEQQRLIQQQGYSVLRTTQYAVAGLPENEREAYYREQARARTEQFARQAKEGKLQRAQEREQEKIRKEAEEAGAQYARDLFQKQAQSRSVREKQQLVRQLKGAPLSEEGRRAIQERVDFLDVTSTVKGRADRLVAENLGVRGTPKGPGNPIESVTRKEQPPEPLSLLDRADRATSEQVQRGVEAYKKLVNPGGVPFTAAKGVLQEKAKIEKQQKPTPTRTAKIQALETGIRVLSVPAGARKQVVERPVTTATSGLAAAGLSFLAPTAPLIVTGLAVIGGGFFIAETRKRFAEAQTAEEQGEVFGGALVEIGIAALGAKAATQAARYVTEIGPTRIKLQTERYFGGRRVDISPKEVEITGQGRAIYAETRRELQPVKLSSIQEKPFIEVTRSQPGATFRGKDFRLASVRNVQTGEISQSVTIGKKTFVSQITPTSETTAVFRGDRLLRRFTGAPSTEIIQLQLRETKITKGPEEVAQFGRKGFFRQQAVRSSEGSAAFGRGEITGTATGVQTVKAQARIQKPPKFIQASVSPGQAVIIERKSPKALIEFGEEFGVRIGVRELERGPFQIVTRQVRPAALKETIQTRSQASAEFDIIEPWNIPKVLKSKKSQLLVGQAHPELEPLKYTFKAPVPAAPQAELRISKSFLGERSPTYLVPVSVNERALPVSQPVSRQFSAATSAYDLRSLKDLREIEVQLPRTEITPVQVTESLTRGVQRAKSRQRAVQEQAQTQVLAQAKSRQRAVQEQAQTQVLAQKSLLANINEPITPGSGSPPPEIPEIPPPPPFVPVGGTARAKESEAETFDVFVRRRGEFKKIAEASSPQEAFRIGKRRVETTAAASFKIEGERGFKLPTPKNFYASAKEPGVFIQRREKRISSLGEKQEITAKGLLTLKEKKSIFTR